jgi:flavin reductase (DIM6/NTAB) family NADH-FMN oxidoreductase RutF
MDRRTDGLRAPHVPAPGTSSEAPRPPRLKSVMRRHASGVTVITTMVREPSGQRPAGFCATSLTPLSFDPPVISFSVAAASASGQAWAAAGRGLVHLLRGDQADVAAAFARPGPGKFTDVAWVPGPDGQPLVLGVLGWLLVSPRTVVDVAEHRLVICDVLACHADSGQPLVHHAGGFHALPGG